MHQRRIASIFGLLGIVFFASPIRSEPTVKIDGSSTVFPITEAVAEEFQNEQKGAIRVTVGISGTGGGFKKFCRGEIDIQDASRPILIEEIEACRKNGIQYYELPIAYDAMTIAVSPKNTWVQNITIAELKKIWEPAAQNVVMNWNQIHPEWPNAPLKLYGAGSDSGTFDYFTEAVVGKAKASRGDYTASEDDNTLVQGIHSDHHALGYIPFAYYESNKNRLKALAVNGILPSMQTVENGTYFPFSRPIFIYVSAKATTRPEVKAFAVYYLTHASALAKQVQYVPLPKEAYALAMKNFEVGKLGTAFGGKPEVGIKIEDLLQREAKH